ncbi:MAG TPA: DHHA1 domain-containing protein, partial [Candidatus Deferrimicrobium sp.]
LALRKMGKTATVLNADPVPANLLFLPGADTVVFAEDGSTYDVAVVVDCGSPERTGRVARELVKCPLLVNIDHHRTNGDLGELSLVDPDAAATGLLIHRVLSAMKYEIGLDVATNLYVAVLTDTGSFHYGSSSPEAFEVAGDMVRRGVDPWAVAEQVYETQSALRLRLLGRVLDSLDVSSDGRVACITTMCEDLREFDSGKDALEGFINYPRSIVGVEVAVSIREEEEELFRVSFRSKGRVDVSAVAARFGGGGHHNAAGCSVTGPLADVKKRVLEALSAVLS